MNVPFIHWVPLLPLGAIAIQPDYGLLVPFEGINQFSESTAYCMP